MADTQCLIPTALTCNYMRDPLGVDDSAPGLSWKLTGFHRGARQTAYQIQAATSVDLMGNGGPDLWDSGRINSDQSVMITYNGAQLKSRQRVYWRVRVWDENSRPSDFSKAHFWEMGLLNASDWEGKWISSPEQRPEPPATAPPCPILRRTITLAKKVISARAYVCGLGWSELYINGRKMGDRLLDPPFTQYDRRSLYTTYDVTEALKTGANALGVILGNGWYNPHTKDEWHFETAPWRHNPKLLLQLAVKYEDGTVEQFASDESWKASTGPIVFDAVRNGEVYDARQEKPDWASPNCNESRWTLVQVVPGPGGTLHSHQGTPVRLCETINPVSVREVQPGVFVFDMGQNFTGWAQLTVSGSAGATVKMRYAEKIHPDGQIDPSNIDCFVYSGEFQTDTYILKGAGVEVWEPRFTYHGFQYVQMTGFPGVPTVNNLSGRVVHTAFEEAGRFECSDPVVNKIQECTRRSYLSNFVGIPTDCPHREKNGWTGDAQLAAETGLLNFHAETAYRKWLNDLKDAQRISGELPGIVPSPGWGYNWGNGPAWDSALVMIPWFLYLYCGDLHVFSLHYEEIRRYVDYLGTLATDDIVSYGLGDWCPPGGQFDRPRCPEALTSTAWYYVHATVVSHIACLLNHPEEAQDYASLADRIKGKFNARFYDPATGCYAGGSQTANGCALFQGLVPEGEVDKVAKQLKNAISLCEDHLDFGILGAKYVLNALTDMGEAELAFKMITQKSFPSWGNWIEQGVTTLWENWDGGSSRNHIMFGDVSHWFYRTLAGIDVDPEAPGFKNSIIHPRVVGELTWARGEHHSPYGVLRCSWNVEGGQFILHIEAPANTTAQVYIPAEAVEEVKEGTRSAFETEGVHFLRMENHCAVFRVQSGTYRFSAALPGV